MSYQPVIGLEIHVELLTKTKLFCGCLNKFGLPPNQNTCPVCLGLPGALPVANKSAVEHVIKSALALNCKVLNYSKFDRKNYFYPDMPKNYQISQYELPVAKSGYLEIQTAQESKKIKLTRIHLEEDTGKSIHSGAIDQSLYTLEDYNRSGIPLMEIVTQPDISSPKEAHEFLNCLRNILRWIKVSDCKMEEGSLRCDANISLKRNNENYQKTEIKNMNSFRSVYKALEYEINRQKEILEKGEQIKLETRGWDEEKLITIPMRSKEEVHDYRYFPEPDIPPIAINNSWIEEIKKSIPELPQQKIIRFQKEYNLSSYDSKILNTSKEMADLFEDTLKHTRLAKEAANWLTGDIGKFLNENNLEIYQTKLTGENLARLVNLIEKKVISGKIAKSIIKDCMQGSDPEKIIKEKGLYLISDKEKLTVIIKGVLKENQKIVADYKDGKVKAFAYLVGQIMKNTGGKADPELTSKILHEELS